MFRRFALGTLISAVAAYAAAGPYDVPAQRAADWLSQQQNTVDGSWGANDDVRYLDTSEAVLALGAINRRSTGFYGGITWLENHAAANADFRARRVLALHDNGDSVADDVQYMQIAQSVSLSGGSGWGLSGAYHASPLDTALALLACRQAGLSAPVSAALTYLKATQLTSAGNGWAIGNEAVSDPFTTAQVLRALIAFAPGNTSLNVPIANGLAALKAMVTNASPVSQQALAALAMLRYDPHSSNAAVLLGSLLSLQGANGSWNGDVYATALALQALAAGMGADLAAQRTAVAIPDANLRTAINAALGRNALDSLNRGELAQLTSLDISNRGITSLTGLEYATNLSYLDARENSITSYDPISGLTQLTTALTDKSELEKQVVMQIITSLLLSD